MLIDKPKRTDLNAFKSESKECMCFLIRNESIVTNTMYIAKIFSDFSMGVFLKIMSLSTKGAFI
jgi:hypothetical protein